MGGRRASLPTRWRVRRASVVGCLIGGMLAALPAPGATAAVPSGFVDELVVGGLNQPTVAAFAPNGRVFIGEKSGIVKTYDSIADTTPTTTVDLRDEVHDFWDRGLLGITVDPQFPTRPYVYALYSYDALPGGTHPRWGDTCPTPPGATSDGCLITGRLSKLTVNTATGVATGVQPLITDWCQQYPSHSIGTVTFGPDGNLYVGGGDGASFNFADYGQDNLTSSDITPDNPCGDPPSAVGTVLTRPTAKGGALRSQSPERPSTEPKTLDGAILRVDPDTGLGVAGNPFASSTDVNAKRIIAYGMRNQFRFVFRPGSSELWVGDVGWNTWEEINRIPNATDTVAENFGWPCYEGGERQSGYDGLDLNVCESLYTRGQNGPYYAYNHAAKVVSTDPCPTGGSAISGIAFENGSNYPEAYQGALFFSDSSRGCIWAMQRGTNGLPDSTKLVPLVTGVSVPVQVLAGPGGHLYYIALGAGQLRRVTYPTGNQAPTAVATAAPTSGPAPLTVHFDGSGSTDPNPGDALSYAWDLDGDGAYDDATGPTAEHTYLEQSLVRAGLRVTDQAGLTGTTTVNITVGAPQSPNPVVAIDTPTAELTWQVGQTVQFSGRAADPQDGELPPSALSWRLTMQHCSATNCHAHVMQDFTGVSGGSFAAPDHSYPSYLELRLTAKDSNNNSTSETVRLDPKTVQLNFASVPSGRSVVVGGESAPTPFSRTVIVGSGNSISAPNPQSPDPGDYWFTSWSDGLEQAHGITAPSTPATYTANYLTCTVSGAKVPDCGGATPSAPRSVTTKGARGKATISWQAPYWPGHGGLAKYQITISPGDKLYEVAPGATSFTVGGLGNGKSYSFSVRAFSKFGGAGPAGVGALGGARVASSTSPSTIVYGSSTTVKGTFTDSGSGAPLAGARIELLGRSAGATAWSTLTSGTTDSAGVMRFLRRTGMNYEYRLAFEGSSSHLGTISAVRPVTVRQNVVAGFSDSTVRRGSTTVLSGQVGPNHRGQTVYLQRYSGGKWVTVLSRTLSSTSGYSFAFSKSTAGTYRYRVVRYNHGDHASGVGPVRTLTVG